MELLLQKRANPYYRNLKGQVSSREYNCIKDFSKTPMDMIAKLKPKKKRQQMEELIKNTPKSSSEPKSPRCMRLRCIFFDSLISTQKWRFRLFTKQIHFYASEEIIGTMQNLGPHQVHSPLFYSREYRLGSSTYRGICSAPNSFTA